MRHIGKYFANHELVFMLSIENKSSCFVKLCMYAQARTHTVEKQKWHIGANRGMGTYDDMLMVFVFCLLESLFQVNPGVLKIKRLKRHPCGYNPQVNRKV